ncbi:GNAT family N-acetyltransferase [Leifsonia sp. NPDC058292]|uniref:GNAT family N-acetyltransferase n=1 Tax=Leifsonia sp. NPDC058292 TaxID=3346428 RepID=UPI0036DE59B3
MSDPTVGAFAPVPDPRPEDTAWPEMSWPPAPGTELVGRYVRLSPVDPDRDAEGLFRALDHDSVWNHLAGRPASADVVHARIANRPSGDSRLQWTVRTAVDYLGIAAGTVIGQTSYLDVVPADARCEIGSTAYAPAVWASAVNPEVKLLLLEYAFEHLNTGRVQLKTDARNQRSQRAIERLGARFEGVLRRHMRRDDGTVRDTVMFSIIAEEWPEVRARLNERLLSAPRR